MFFPSWLSCKLVLIGNFGLPSLCPLSIWSTAFLHFKTDLSFLRFGWSHKLLNGLKNGLNLLVVIFEVLLKFYKLPCKLLYVLPSFP